MKWRRAMEKRNFFRTALKRDYTAQFQLDGQTHSRVQVSNISINGCCLLLPAASSQRLSEQPVLDTFVLFHDARRYTVRSRIVWHDLRGDGITAGVAFLDIPRDCIRAIRESAAEEMFIWNIAI
jgi:c-di-GMP-binding flagellar brake protein YcgR